MKKLFLIVLFASLALSLGGCAAQSVDLGALPDTEEKIPGFWQGLWHGIIAPITFIISLFNRNIAMYAVINNGAWYNLGFLFGMSIIFGGSGGGAVARRRHKKVIEAS